MLRWLLDTIWRMKKTRQSSSPLHSMSLLYEHVLTSFIAVSQCLVIIQTFIMVNQCYYFFFCMTNNHCQLHSLSVSRANYITLMVTTSSDRFLRIDPLITINGLFQLRGTIPRWISQSERRRTTTCVRDGVPIISLIIAMHRPVRVNLSTISRLILSKQ